MLHEWEVGIENQLIDLRTRIEALEQVVYITAQKKVEAKPSASDNTESSKCHFCRDLVNSYPLYRYCPFCGKYLNTSSVS